MPTDAELVAYIRANPCQSLAELCVALGAETSALRLQLRRLRYAGRLSVGRGQRWEVVEK